MIGVRNGFTGAAFYVGAAVKHPSSCRHEVLAERTPRPLLHLVLLQHAGALVASVYVRTLRSANNLLSVVAGRLRRHAPHPVCAKRRLRSPGD